MKKIIIPIYILLLFGCNNQDAKKEMINATKDSRVDDRAKYSEDLKRKSILNGDSEAYGSLVDYYYNEPSQYYELLSISIIMADKYNNDNARVSIFFQTIMLDNNGKHDETLFFKLKQSHKDFVLSYLIEGVKNQNPGCKGIMRKLIKNGLKVDKEIQILLV